MKKACFGLGHAHYFSDDGTFIGCTARLGTGEHCIVEFRGNINVLPDVPKDEAARVDEESARKWRVVDFLAGESE